MTSQESGRTVDAWWPVECVSGGDVVHRRVSNLSQQQQQCRRPVVQCSTAGVNDNFLPSELLPEQPLACYTRVFMWKSKWTGSLKSVIPAFKIQNNPQLG